MTTLVCLFLVGVALSCVVVGLVLGLIMEAYIYLDEHWFNHRRVKTE